MRSIASPSSTRENSYTFSFRDWGKKNETGKKYLFLLFATFQILHFQIFLLDTKSFQHLIRKWNVAKKRDDIFLPIFFSHTLHFWSSFVIVNFKHHTLVTKSQRRSQIQVLDLELFFTEASKNNGDNGIIFMQNYNNKGSLKG